MSTKHTQPHEPGRITIEQDLFDIVAKCEQAGKTATRLMVTRALYTSPTAATQEIQRLRDVLALIEAQDQGCGGNLSAEEIYKAMQRLAREALR